MMPDNQGFLYEQKINKLLKANGVEKKSFVPAGSDSNAPDAQLTLGGDDYKTELKLDIRADFGQGSLDYDLDKKKWILGGSNTPAGMAMREFLTMVGVPGIVNRAWGSKGAPRKFTVPLNKFTPKDVAYDYANFRDQFVPVDSQAISKYYASKKTYYIQVSGHGLFYMVKDPADLGCAKFNPQIRLRIRLKRGGSLPIYNYRFSTALQVVSLGKSNIDLENVADLKAMLAKTK
jgi:hypothetical protein